MPKDLETKLEGMLKEVSEEDPEYSDYDGQEEDVYEARGYNQAVKDIKQVLEDYFKKEEVSEYSQIDHLAEGKEPEEFFTNLMK